MEENKEIIETPIQEPVPTTEPVPVPADPKPVNEVKTSGTATEEEINIDASKPATEILDEYAINKDVKDQEKKFKKNWNFIIFIVILIIAFIILLPILIKKRGF